MSDTGVDDPEGGEAGEERVASNGAITARYAEANGERVLTFEREGRTATLAQNAEGYAMVSVREGADGEELERYYGFDMALDHAAELLAASPVELPIPEAAADMGM
jgi:hypothetical protein